MTVWVHRPADGRPFGRAKLFAPPAPRPVPGLGYARFHVEVDGFTFIFASLAEVDRCVATLGRKTLPSTDRETDSLGRRASPALAQPAARRNKVVAL